MGTAKKANETKIKCEERAAMERHCWRDEYKRTRKLLQTESEKK